MLKIFIFSVEKLKLIPLVNTITIQPLEGNDFKALVCAKISDKIKPNSLQKEISNVLFDRTHGNPLYTIELMTTLIEQNLIRVVGNTINLDKRVLESGEIPLPDSLQGILTSRIDRLEPRCQLLVKLASVVGGMMIDNNILM
jgi:predicted ATPase